MKSLRQVKSLFACGAVLVGMAGATASAAELKLAHFMPPKHPMDRGVMTPLTEEIKAATDGELTIRIYPAGELGKGPVQQYKRVVTGVADIAFGIPAYTPTQFPKTTLVHMPGLFSDGTAATNALWDNLPSIEDEYGQVKLLGLWANNPAVFISREKPVRNLADLQGMKVRTPNTIMAKVVEAWGAIPVSMPITETYNAMNTGVIDAVIMGPSGIRSYKMNEVAKFITTNLPTAVDSFYILMNKTSWDALSDEQKAELEKVTGREMSLRGADAFYNAGQAGLKIAEDANVEMLEASDADVAAMREAMAEAVNAYVAQVSKDANADGAAIVAGFAGK
ncbi:MAG: TRAP transporter substrate-binding protein [Stappiaceae bacterium]